jgi:hypothetical protein
VPFPPDPAGPGLRVFHDRWISMVLAAVGQLSALRSPLVEYRLHGGQHVGIPHLTLRQVVPPGVLAWQQVRLPEVHVTNRISLFIELLQTVAKRVDEGLEGPRRADALARIDRCLRHLDFRRAVRLDPGGTRRAVVRRLIDGEYGEYSLGLASAVSDLRVRSRPATG